MNNKIKKTFSDRCFNLINTLIMLAIAFIMIYPVYYVIIASISNAEKLVSFKGILFRPLAPTLLAYEQAFKNPMLLRSYANTIFVVVVGTMVSMIFTILGAYVLSRNNARLVKPAMIMVTITMFFSGGMIPFYFAVRDLGLDGSLWALIFPSAINTFNLIIMKTAFMAVPSSLEESANIDGAGHFTILLRIILPVSKSVLAVIALYYAVARWNAWFGAMLFLEERESYPLQLILREILIQNDMSNVSEGVASAELGFISVTIKYAIIVIATVPILCVYPFVQKYFTKGVLIGSVKG
ncbi:carbohydrate ABC transporter permease [Ructibacterium gallinarum]|uniref:Carbohydrate ABC transporter permease n=1 Tax=Ructibacterium gallinarum TaxID=2779355 RepID=A0A9D5M292_9FIRM|nr:carbohydrate ABC transporter permease [Ructibacterium gallinarum]MBE5040806.1 carbohydrate ABC transporter permease [Ructibacterium gallinarum]